MLVCVQCALKALLDDQPPPTFDQTPGEHFRSHHPDPEVTKRERAVLIARFRAKWPAGVLPGEVE